MGSKEWVEKLLSVNKDSLSEGEERENDRPVVLVVGRDYFSNLAVARSVGKAGYRSEVLHVYDTTVPRVILQLLFIPRSEMFSKYVSRYYPCITQRDGEEIYRALCRYGDQAQRKLLIPTDDLAAAVVDTHYDALKTRYIIQNVKDTQGAICELMDKRVQKELAQRFGIPVVNGRAIRVCNGSFHIPSGVRYPCFIKPNVSMTAAKSTIQACQNREELEKALSSFAPQKELDVMVEDYVKIATEYTLLGISAGDTAIAPAFYTANKDGDKERRGATLVGRTLSCQEQAVLIEKLRRFVSSLGFTGLYNIDLIEDAAGHIYFTEINLRYAAAGCVFAQSGLNLPGMYADHVFSGKPIDTDCENSRPGLRFAAERGLLDCYTKGIYTRSQIRKIMDEADVLLMQDADDPAPYENFKKFYRRVLPLKIRKIVTDAVKRH